VTGATGSAAACLWTSALGIIQPTAGENIATDGYMLAVGSIDAYGDLRAYAAGPVLKAEIDSTTGNIVTAGDLGCVNIVATGDVTVTSEILPAANNTGTIGRAAGPLWWNAVYASNVFAALVTTSNLTVNGNITVTGTVDGVDVLNHGHSLAYTATASGHASLTMNHRHDILAMCTNIAIPVNATHYHTISASTFYTGYQTLSHTHEYDKTNTPTGAPA